MKARLQSTKESLVFFLPIVAFAGVVGLIAWADSMQEPRTFPTVLQYIESEPQAPLDHPGYCGPKRAPLDHPPACND